MLPLTNPHPFRLLLLFLSLAPQHHHIFPILHHSQLSITVWYMLKIIISPSLQHLAVSLLFLLMISLSISPTLQCMNYHHILILLYITPHQHFQLFALPSMFLPALVSILLTLRLLFTHLHFQMSGYFRLRHLLKCLVPIPLVPLSHLYLFPITCHRSLLKAQMMSLN